MSILYVVATPIGNLDEMTKRALSVLCEVDIIAAEDTRSTGLLFERLSERMVESDQLGESEFMVESERMVVSHKMGLSHRKAKFVSYHKFNEAARVDLLIGKLKAGLSVALVSDAGTPCISDPGRILVAAAAKCGVPVVGVSGPSAITLALSVSGFPAEPFVFVGFLPKKAKAVLDVMGPLLSGNSFLAGDSFLASDAFFAGNTVVFYESPKRIAATVRLFAEHFPRVSLCLCNDLTKRYERVYRGTPGEVLESLMDNARNFEKGEYTCVVYLAGDVASESEENEDSPGLSLEGMLVDVMVKTGCTLKEAVKSLDYSGNKYSKNEAYAASIRLRELLEKPKFG